MSDYSDLCELYGISPNDCDGFDKILSIWADNEKQPYRYSGSKRTSVSKISKGKWVPAPLGIKEGNLEKWKELIKKKCPSPKLGQVVIIDNNGKPRIGYERIILNHNVPSWRRVIWQENADDNKFEDCPF